MTPVQIIIPVIDYENVLRYYRDVLQFEMVGRRFLLPTETRDVVLKLIRVGEESRKNNPPRRYFPIFNFSIADNFLSYCDNLMSRGALVEKIISHPGGYYAEVADPEGNQFEIECDSFEEENDALDPFDWPVYRRY